MATVIVAALAHAVLIYTFHFVEPAVKNRIENAQQVSKAIEKAYGDARQEIERNAQELTESLRQSVLFEAQQQIGAQTAAHIRGAGLLAARTGETLRGGVVIPGAARDAGRGSLLFDLRGRRALAVLRAYRDARGSSGLAVLLFWVAWIGWVGGLSVAVALLLA